MRVKKSEMRIFSCREYVTQLVIDFLRAIVTSSYGIQDGLAPATKWLLTPVDVIFFTLFLIFHLRLGPL